MADAAIVELPFDAWKLWLATGERVAPAALASAAWGLLVEPVAGPVETVAAVCTGTAGVPGGWVATVDVLATLLARVVMPLEPEGAELVAMGAALTGVGEPGALPPADVESPPVEAAIPAELGVVPAAPLVLAPAVNVLAVLAADVVEGVALAKLADECVAALETSVFDVLVALTGTLDEVAELEVVIVVRPDAAGGFTAEGSAPAMAEGVLPVEPLFTGLVEPTDALAGASEAGTLAGGVVVVPVEFVDDAVAEGAAPAPFEAALTGTGEAVPRAARLVVPAAPVVEAAAGDVVPASASREPPVAPPLAAFRASVALGAVLTEAFATVELGVAVVVPPEPVVEACVPPAEFVVPGTVPVADPVAGLAAVVPVVVAGAVWLPALCVALAGVAVTPALVLLEGAALVAAAVGVAEPAVVVGLVALTEPFTALAVVAAGVFVDTAADVAPYSPGSAPAGLETVSSLTATAAGSFE